MCEAKDLTDMATAPPEYFAVEEIRIFTNKTAPLLVPRAVVLSLSSLLDILAEAMPKRISDLKENNYRILHEDGSIIIPRYWPDFITSRPTLSRVFVILGKEFEEKDALHNTFEDLLNKSLQNMNEALKGEQGLSKRMEAESIKKGNPTLAKELFTHQIEFEVLIHQRFASFYRWIKDGFQKEQQSSMDLKGDAEGTEMTAEVERKLFIGITETCSPFSAGVIETPASQAILHYVLYAQWVKYQNGGSRRAWDIALSEHYPFPWIEEAPLP